ncbi:MAG: tyrosine-type recombinase/integrase [Chloroflexi bacterium]|nr:tyrosine-type recombinase/integrase [Chloroflexota bacterium]
MWGRMWGTRMGKLTAASAKALSKPGLHGDGGTLYLHVSASGSRSWIQRIVYEGRRHDLGLGAFPAVPLAEARRRAAANRLLVAAGGDPLEGRRRAKVPTFRQAAEQTYQSYRPRWRSEKVAAVWLQSMERYAFPVIGMLPVNRVGREDVLKILTPIWGSKPETARKLRQRIRATLKWCMAKEYVAHNVAGELIDGALPAMPSVQAHHPALHYREVPAAVAKVEGSGASLAARLCFRFLVLTAARSGEARGALWSEIDLEAREWRIPPERMKEGAEHRVPLPDAAVAVIEQARPLRDRSGLVFPSPARANRPLSENTLSKLLRDLGLPAVPHGFRASFRTWASEQTNAPHAVMEQALAHAVSDPYSRGDHMKKRRKLMKQWARFVTSGEA